METGCAVIALTRDLDFWEFWIPGRPLRFFTPNFCKILATWNLTVLGEIANIWPISLFEKPSIKQAIICCSRLVNLGDGRTEPSFCTIYSLKVVRGIHKRFEIIASTAGVSSFSTFAIGTIPRTPKYNTLVSSWGLRSWVSRMTGCFFMNPWRRVISNHLSTECVSIINIYSRSARSCICAAENGWIRWPLGSSVLSIIWDTKGW